MAIGTKRVFRQNILGADVLGIDPDNGTVEICVLGGTQASPEDKEAFLKELASCFREAYSWTAAQLGVVAKNEANEPKTNAPDYDNDIEFAAAASAAIRNIFKAWAQEKDESTEATDTIEGDGATMANPTMTHDEIKAALALKYGNAQAVCERIHEKAWHTLTKERDIDGYESLMRSMDCAFHHLEGIQAAAEALGITKDELINAVQIAKTEGRLA